MVTADLIRATLRLIGAISSSETPAADESSDALESLNLMLGSWGATRFLSASTAKITKTTTGQISYSIGVAGDINTTRPTSIYNAYWSDGGIDYTLENMDYGDYLEIGVKTVGGIPSHIVLNPDNPLSTIYLYPIPSTGTLTLELIRPEADLTLADELPYPPEWIRAMKFNLAVELSPEFGFSITPELAVLAKESKEIVMRSMVSVPVAKFDPLLNVNRGFNIISGGF